MAPSFPRVLLHIEGGVVLTLGLWAYAHWAVVGWGWFALIILAPDISLLGYAAGPRVGAATYNAAHTYVGPALVAIGMWLGFLPTLWALPFLWAAHIGGDRLLGFGLKYPTRFKDTHLEHV